MVSAILTIVLILVVLLAYFCFKLAGGVLKLALKFIICLPCALICAIVGVVLCCTLLLIPLGICSFNMAAWFLNPFKMCFG